MQIGLTTRTNRVPKRFLLTGSVTCLRAETENGVIETTFPVSTQGTINTRHLEIVMGEGGPEALLATRNGNVTIQRAD